MKYQIKGNPMPVVECYMEKGESIKCEQGAMVWMSSNMKMQTKTGGLRSLFSKWLSKEPVFQNIYTAEETSGYIAFASSFPGDIVAFELKPGHDIICQKSAYLASSTNVELSIFLQKKLGSGFFGGEGFIMQKLSGNGMVFLEVDGSTVMKTLKEGESIVLETGCLAMMDASCKVDVTMVKGLVNKFWGGEGWFNTVVTGPGRVVLQTMPASQFAKAILPFIPLPVAKPENK